MFVQSGKSPLGGGNAGKGRDTIPRRQDRKPRRASVLGKGISGVLAHLLLQTNREQVETLRCKNIKESVVARVPGEVFFAQRSAVPQTARDVG